MLLTWDCLDITIIGERESDPLTILWDHLSEEIPVTQREDFRHDDQTGYHCLPSCTVTDIVEMGHCI